MVDLTLERQPDVTDAMQKAAVKAYEAACEEIGIQFPSIWGYPLSCAIQAALDVRRTESP